MVSTVAFSLKGGGWYGDGYGTKPEAGKSEAEKTGTTAIAEVSSTDTTPKETKEPTATPAAPASGQSETNNAVAEKPATAEKTKLPTESASQE